MAHPSTQLYAQLPVFKYQTFDQASISYSIAPASRPLTNAVRYYGKVTDLAPKSNEAPKDTSAKPAAAETPADSTPDSAPQPQGQHEHQSLAQSFQLTHN